MTLRSLFLALCLPAAAVSAGTPSDALRPDAGLAAFRAELRAFYPDWGQGVRDEVAAALAKCPADDPLGRKELETALVGLDTIHEIQLKFHEEAKRRLGGAVGARALPKPNDRAAACPTRASTSATRTSRSTRAR